MSLCVAMRFKGVEVSFESGDAVEDAASVSFEFRLAGSARPDAAAEAGKLRSFATKAWQKIFQLRQFHLKFALAGACVQGKDIEDEHSAVEDFQFKDVFEVARLGWGEVFVNDDAIGFEFLRETGNAFSVTVPHECSGMDFAQTQMFMTDDLAACCVSQLRQFIQRLFPEGKRMIWERHSYEEKTFRLFCRNFNIIVTHGGDNRQSPQALQG